MIKTPCPKSESLGRYVLGTMDAIEVQNIERHLLECQACCDQAETLNPCDEVTKAFRLPQKSHGPDEEIVSNLIQRVAKLGSASTETRSIQLASQGTWEENAGDDRGATEVAATDLLSPPQGTGELGRLGDYRVLKILGSGGMGFVYLAEDERLRRRVALKVMKPSEARKQGAKDRFLREARATAAVEHDNIIAIHQVGEDRGIPFIAMPMLQGASLKTLLQDNKRMTQLRAISTCRQVAAGLFAAHQTGLIHRDIKPDNLWIESTKGRVKILDFGLVRDLESVDGLTLQGTVLGTPSYMSPEQASGQPVDHRSDLFSLGAVFYQMLSGQSPYAASTVTATLLNVARAQPTPIESLVPDLDPEVIKLVSDLNARDPKDRPQSAGDVIRTLDRIGSRLVSERQASQQQPSKPPDKTVAAPELVRTQPATRSPKTPWGKYAVAGGAAAFLMAITFYLQIGKVNVQITLDDPSIALKIDGTDVLIDDGKAITRLSAGSHQLTVNRDGFATVTDEFSVEKNGKNVIHVSIAEGRVKIDEGDVPTLPGVPVTSNMSSAPVIAPQNASGGNSSVPEVRAAQWLLSHEPSFNFRLQSKRDANVHWEYLPGESKPLPTEPYQFRDIFLSDTFTDKHQDATASQIAPNVQGIRDLFSLRIRSKSMTSAGFAKVIAVPEFSKVSQIELSGPRFDDRIFEALVQLPNLAKAHLSLVPRMTGEGIGRLSECPLLETIGWTATTPNVQSMEELSKLPYLTGLEINEIECTEQHAMAIAKLDLLALLLYNSHLDDAMVRHLATIAPLETLNIQNSEVTDVGLRELQSLKALKVLDIRNNPITTAGLAEFKKAVPKCKIITDLSQPDA